MLSRLFATEACYTIKETNKNKKSHFAEASYHFHLSYHFVSENWEKPICFSIFLVIQITILPTQIKKSREIKKYVVYTMLV